jgi:hypothetical protein
MKKIDYLAHLVYDKVISLNEAILLESETDIASLEARLAQAKELERKEKANLIGKYGDQANDRRWNDAGNLVDQLTYELEQAKKNQYQWED